MTARFMKDYSNQKRWVKVDSRTWIEAGNSQTDEDVRFEYNARLAEKMRIMKNGIDRRDN